MGSRTSPRCTSYIAKLPSRIPARTSTCSFTATYHGRAGVVGGLSPVTSEDRKPRPGMAMAAEAALNLDLTASWVVGDRPKTSASPKRSGHPAGLCGTG